MSHPPSKRASSWILFHIKTQIQQHAASTQSKHISFTITPEKWMVPEKLYHASSGHIQLRKVEADPLQQTDTTVLPAASTGLPLQRNSLISIDVFLMQFQNYFCVLIIITTLFYVFNMQYKYIHLLPPFPSNTIM